MDQHFTDLIHHWSWLHYTGWPWLRKRRQILDRMKMFTSLILNFFFRCRVREEKKGKLFCALNGWALIMIALFWHQNVQLQSYCSISWQQANFSWLVQTKQWWFYHSLGRIILFCSDIPIHVRNNALLCPMTKAWHWNSWNFMTQFNFASIMRQQHRLDRNNGRFIKYVSPTQSLKPLHPWN